MSNLYDDVQTLKSKLDEAEIIINDLKEKLKFFQNSPLIVGYTGKRLDLNENIDVAQVLGRLTNLEGQVATLEGYH